MKKKYWILENGMLAVTQGAGWSMRGATEISKSKYYAMLKEQRRMSNEIEENGFTMDRSGNLYFG
jgi:hypothetical protein